MSHALSKRIILSPLQLQRLLGRDRELTSRSDAARLDALASASKAAPKIGPAQAYAQYRAVQQRHLNQAAQEREAPLELIVSDPATPSRPGVQNDLIDFSEEEENVPNPVPTPEPQTPERQPKKVKRVPKVPRQWKTTQSRLQQQFEEDVGGPSSTPKSRRLAVRKSSSIKPPVWSPVRTRAGSKNKAALWLRYGKPNSP